jgi:hypothetical protein
MLACDETAEALLICLGTTIGYVHREARALGKEMFEQRSLPSLKPSLGDVARAFRQSSNHATPDGKRCPRFDPAPFVALDAPANYSIARGAQRAAPSIETDLQAPSLKGGPGSSGDISLTNLLQGAIGPPATWIYTMMAAPTFEDATSK